MEDLIGRPLEVGDIILYRVKSYGNGIRSELVLISELRDSSFKGFSVSSYRESLTHEEAENMIDTIHKAPEQAFICNDLWTTETPFKSIFQQIARYKNITPNLNRTKASVETEEFTPLKSTEEPVVI
jgi:hypothetical protein